MTLPRLGIIANTGKPQVEKILSELLPWLNERDIQFVISDDLVDILDLGNSKTLPPEQIADESDFVLSFGGDGTFLRTAHMIVPREVPIIGVNLGTFGYLAEVGADQIYERIEDLMNGQFHVQERSMLEATIEDETQLHSFIALNDIVIQKGEFPRTIRLETSIDGEYLNTFHADGLIVSTPTGSTGYSLSVGGPILEPQMDVLIIDPISPHMLANRPFVVDGGRAIVIRTFTQADKYHITVDGNTMLKAISGTEVVIRRALSKTKVVVFGQYSFYELLRNKLHWRDQLSER